LTIVPGSGARIAFRGGTYRSVGSTS